MIILVFLTRLFAKILVRNPKSWQEIQNYPRSWQEDQDAKHWERTTRRSQTVLRMTVLRILGYAQVKRPVKLHEFLRRFYLNFPILDISNHSLHFDEIFAFFKRTPDLLQI